MLSEQLRVGKAGDQPLRINDLQSFGHYTPHYLHLLLEGDAQPQIHVQLPSAMIDFQRNVQQAVSASRWSQGCFLVIQILIFLRGLLTHAMMA